jgi:hypothetical protein
MKTGRIINMKTQKQPTPIEEMSYILRKYNWKGLRQDLCWVQNNRRWKINQLEMSCALHAHKTSPLKEAAITWAYALGWAVFASIPIMITSVFTYETLNFPENMGSKPIVATLCAFGAKKLLFGHHPTSNYGSYYDVPFFGVVDYARFSLNWLKIAGMQALGKIRKGPDKLDSGSYNSKYADIQCLNDGVYDYINVLEKAKRDEDLRDYLKSRPRPHKK